MDEGGEVRILVTGAGGFIGHHLVKRLVREGCWVRGADLKLPEYEDTSAHEFIRCDLRVAEDCRMVVEGVERVYHLAADMGGIGYITTSHAAIMRNNILINTNMIEAAQLAGVERFLFSSSACVYPQRLQADADVTPLKEEDAFPADAEPGYGWEKLFMELMCRYYREDFGLGTRIVRFHNVYGPLGTYDGGKEKAPAAICRKVALARDGGRIGIWGDGEQTRSFMFIDDCIEGLLRLMDSDYHEPLNLGTDELVTIDQLVSIVEKVAGKRLVRYYDLTAPQGVRGRNSDNTQLKKVLGWEPTTLLADGMVPTYRWIAERVKEGK